MSELVATTSPATEGNARRLVQFLWPILALLLLLRLLVAAHVELAPDEAFYWMWTRHLAPGYLDHPPMIALLMWLSTRAFGNTELGVRFPAAVLSLASVGVLAILARRLLNDSRAAGFVVLMWIVSPLLAVLGLIFTPDTPAVFFSVCGLACAALIADRDDRLGAIDRRTFADSAGLWLVFGLFCGLALDSKYTTVLLPAAVGAAILLSRLGRRHLRRPWIYLSLVVALLVFSPVIYWNATHQWASFRFQLKHGSEQDAALTTLGQRFSYGLIGFLGYLGGQAVVWTPLLFALTILLLFRNWRGYVRLREADRVLLWSGTLPLAFFAFASTRSHGEINWPAFAYFPLSILIARYLAENWRGHRVKWAREGCKLALVMLIGLHLLAIPAMVRLLDKLHVPLPHSVTDLSGWRAFGQQVAQRAGGLPVVCNRHQDAGEAAFYTPGQPDVWCEGVGSRPTAFDYFDRGRPDYSRIDRLLYIGGHVPQFTEKYGYSRATPLEVIRLPGPGRARTRGAEVIER